MTNYEKSQDILIELEKRLQDWIEKKINLETKVDDGSGILLSYSKFIEGEISSTKILINQFKEISTNLQTQ